MNTNQLRWALAGAKRPCECQYCQEPEQGVVPSHSPFSYVLPDSIRVPCGGTLTLDFMDRPCHWHAGIGWADGCLGYTPATDLGAWAKVLYPIMRESAEPEVFGAYVRACAMGETETALGAAYSTLQAQGVKLEVKE